MDSRVRGSDGLGDFLRDHQNSRQKDPSFSFQFLISLRSLWSPRRGPETSIHHPHLSSFIRGFKSQRYSSLKSNCNGHASGTETLKLGYVSDITGEYGIARDTKTSIGVSTCPYFLHGVKTQSQPSHIHSISNHISRLSGGFQYTAP